MTATGPVAQCFKFRENMRDAADSAQRNFPEGFGRFSPGDFARFLDHSKASLMEVKTPSRAELSVRIGHQKRRTPPTSSPTAR